MRTLALTWVAAFSLGLLVVNSGAQTTQPEEPAPTHIEVGTIGLDPGTEFGLLSTICSDRQGNLLAADAKKEEIRVYGPDDKLRATWKVGFAPSALCACADGTVYVGGRGKLARLDEAGKVLKVVSGDGQNFPVGRASGLAASDKDLFASFGTGASLSARGVIVRFDRDLGQPKTIATDLRGCCQRLDLQVKDDVLYLAENARYRVVKYDREGQVLGSWGKSDRRSVEGFGACCNPMNLRFGADGSLYTAESGLGRVKRYDTDGKFLGLVGFVDVPRFTSAGHLAASCSNIALAVNKDGTRTYVQDVSKNCVRVLVRKDEGAARSPADKAPAGG